MPAIPEYDWPELPAGTILKAKKALADMESGQTLRVISTDAGSLRDFQAFAKQTGNELIDQETAGADYVHVMRRR